MIESNLGRENFSAKQSFVPICCVEEDDDGDGDGDGDGEDDDDDEDDD